MRFTVTQKNLNTALQAAIRAVPARTTLPALAGILLHAETDALTVQATDLEIAISCTVPAHTSHAGSILLPARQLTEIARRIPTDSVDFHVDTSNATASIQWTGSEFIIHGQPAEHFPGFPDTETGPPLTITRDQLRAAIEGTLFAASQDEARPILTGIHLTLTNGELRAIATDGFRIAYLRTPVTAASPDHVLNVVLPGRNLSELLRFLTASGDVQLHPSKNHVLFQIDNVRFLSRVLEGTFPAVLDLVPKEFRSTLRVDRNALHDAFERVSLFADPLQRAYATSLTCANGTITLSASSAAVGRAREEIPGELRGDPCEIIFNARLLTEGLRSCRGSDILLDISGPLTAARLTSPEDDGFMYIVMPMRPSEA